MKARILDPQVKVYSSMDASALSMATLEEGSEIEIGSMKRKAGKMWRSIILSTGQNAYIPGEARIFMVREGTLIEKSVEMRAEPSAESPVKQQLQRNAKVSILQVVKSAGKDWVKVRDASGNEGYISGDTRVRLAPQRSKVNGRRNMITGGMWLIAGLIFLFSENPATAASGTSLLGIGALVFGLIILVSGIVQYVTAPA